MLKPRKICENCRYWMQGDQTPRGNKISNIGNCTYFLRGVDKVRLHAYDEIQIPPWAQNLAYRTMSWEGESCNVFEISTAYQPQS